MLDRRSLLKLFGVGSVVAPVLSGLPKMPAQALIVEPPKVKLITPQIVEASAIPPMPDLGRNLEVSLHIRDVDNRCVWSFAGRSAILEAWAEVIDVTAHSRGELGWRDLLTTGVQRTWKFEGVFTGFTLECTQTPFPEDKR